MASTTPTPNVHYRPLEAAVAYAEQIVLWVSKELWHVIGGKEESLKEDRYLVKGRFIQVPLSSRF